MFIDPFGFFKNLEHALVSKMFNVSSSKRYIYHALSYSSLYLFQLLITIYIYINICLSVWVNWQLPIDCNIACTNNLGVLRLEMRRIVGEKWIETEKF